MEINNEKIVKQLNFALEELIKARDNTYTFSDLARSNIYKTQGILETIKNLLEE